MKIYIYTLVDFVWMLLRENKEHYTKRINKRIEREKIESYKKYELRLADAKRHIYVKDAKHLLDKESHLALMIDGTPIAKVTNEDNIVAGTISLQNIGVVFDKLRENYITSHQL